MEGPHASFRIGNWQSTIDNHWLVMLASFDL
jgi:hypothetical protein